MKICLPPYRLSVAFQSFIHASRGCCGTATRSSSSSYQLGESPFFHVNESQPQSHIQLLCCRYSKQDTRLSSSCPSAVESICHGVHASCFLQLIPVCTTAWCSWQKPCQWLNSDTALCRMVHGLLQDTHNEFFIQQTVKPDQHATALSAAPSQPQAQSQPPPQSTGDSNATEWHKGFQVSMQALPPNVSVSIAESILFVGKAVRVLQRPTGPLKSHDLLPQSDAISFAQALRQLQQQEVFDQIGFERTVEVIRTKVRHSCSVVDTELLAS